MPSEANFLCAECSTYCSCDYRGSCPIGCSTCLDWCNCLGVRGLNPDLEDDDSDDDLSYEDGFTPSLLNAPGGWNKSLDWNGNRQYKTHSSKRQTR